MMILQIVSLLNIVINIWNEQMNDNSFLNC